MTIKMNGKLYSGIFSTEENKTKKNKGLKIILWRLQMSHAISQQIRARTSLSITISMTVIAFFTTIHAISMSINAIQPGQMKIF